MFTVVSCVAFAIYVLVVPQAVLMTLTVSLEMLARLLDATGRRLKAWSKRQARPLVPLVRSSASANRGTPNPWV